MIGLETLLASRCASGRLGYRIVMITPGSQRRATSLISAQLILLVAEIESQE
jgi:hypothetical protein